MRQPILLLLVLWCGTAEFSHGQSYDSLPIGTRIRVWAPAEGLNGQVGQVASVAEGHIRVRLLRHDSASARLRDVPLVTIDRIDRSAGRGPWGRAATLGGLIGLASGLGLAVLMASNCPGDGAECYVVELGAPPLGLFLGAFAGAAGRPHVWETVPVR